MTSLPFHSGAFSLIKLIDILFTSWVITCHKHAHAISWPWDISTSISHYKFSFILQVIYLHSGYESLLGHCPYTETLPASQFDCTVLGIFYYRRDAKPTRNMLPWHNSRSPMKEIVFSHLQTWTEKLGTNLWQPVPLTRNPVHSPAGHRR